MLNAVIFPKRSFLSALLSTSTSNPSLHASRQMKAGRGIRREDRKPLGPVQRLQQRVPPVRNGTRGGDTRAVNCVRSEVTVVSSSLVFSYSCVFLAAQIRAGTSGAHSYHLN